MNRRKKIALVLLGWLCLSYTSYAEKKGTEGSGERLSRTMFTEPLAGSSITLSDGEKVDVLGGTYGISVTADGEGLKINGAANVRLQTNSDYGSAVELKKGTSANFGQGTVIALVGGISGVAMDDGHELIADRLHVIVENDGIADTFNTGMSLRGDSVNLGNDSKIHVTVGGEARAEGLKLNIGSFQANNLEVRVVNSGLGGSSQGVILNKTNGDFGVGSYVRSEASQSAINNGFVLEDSYLKAKNLTVESFGGSMVTALNVANLSEPSKVELSETTLWVKDSAVGRGILVANGRVNFDQGKIVVGGDSSSTGVQVENGAVFKARDIDIRVQLEGADTGFAVGVHVLNSNDNAASATLEGDITIISDRYAMRVVGQDAFLNGNGKMTLSGDLRVREGGKINLEMQEGSLLSGVTEIWDSGEINLKMVDTTWQITGSSNLTTLDFSDSKSKVIFVSKEGFSGLIADRLVGTGGNFVMRTDLVGDGEGNNTGDFMTFSESEGTHWVTVENVGAAQATGNERLILIRTVDGKADFQSVGATEVGGYLFYLRDVEGSDKKEWELYSNGRASGSGSAGLGLFSGGYLLDYAENQTLLQRMGAIRTENHNGNYWGRTFGGKFHVYGDSVLEGYQMTYSGVQIGYDREIGLKSTSGIFHIGGMASYSRGHLGYGFGSGTIDSKNLGIYGTYATLNGFYSDLTLKYGWQKNQFQMQDSLGNGVHSGDICTQGVSASLEIGKRQYISSQEKQGWYLEPQAQMTIGHRSGDSFTASNGLRISVDAYDSFLGRVGANIGYEVKNGKNPVNAYLKASYLHEFSGNIDYRFNQSLESTKFGGSWWTYGVGVAAQSGKHQIYLDAERATGGEFTQSWAISGGYRITW